VHALAFDPAQQIFFRDLHTFEEQLRGVLPVHAHLVEHAAHAVAGEILRLHHEDGKPLAALGIGAHHQHQQSGEKAVGDESLAAVDDVSVALLHSACTDAFEVRAGTGLGHADGADELACGHARQKALFLRLGAVIQHVVSAHAVHALSEGGDAAAREFGVHHRLMAEISAATAVFGRHVQQQ
jgi:hypothetical protein